MLASFPPSFVAAFGLACLLGVLSCDCSAEPNGIPPHRALPSLPNRAMADGPALYVDAAKGNDTGDGSKQAPSKTIAHALSLLNPGDTLYLRGGVYYEN